jgi:hypothetical protein
MFAWLDWKSGFILDFDTGQNTRRGCEKLHRMSAELLNCVAAYQHGRLLSRALATERGDRAPFLWIITVLESNTGVGSSLWPFAVCLLDLVWTFGAI